ncbi:MAG TPA: hypothetical protein VMN38_12050 [Sphingomicrobium sp.]|nr:hypothetical protein [Sphingomicrobium sp.]
MTIRLVGGLSIAAVLSACATHRLETRDLATAGIGEIYVSRGGAGLEAPRKIVGVRECPTDLIESVEVKRDFGQSLLSLITFGLVDRVTVTYSCKNAKSSIGTTDE